MGNTYDWTLSRVYGTPVAIPSDRYALTDDGGEPDGYGSQLVTMNTSHVEVALGKNKVYRLHPTVDCHIALIDLSPPGGESAEDPVTSSTGHLLKADNDVFITTTRRRHVLSVTCGSSGTLRVQAMVARDGR